MVKDLKSLIATHNFLLQTQEKEKHFKTVPEMPTKCLRLSIKTTWYTVSKAAVRSKSIKLCLMFGHGQLLKEYH